MNTIVTGGPLGFYRERMPQCVDRTLATLCCGRERHRRVTQKPTFSHKITKNKTQTISCGAGTTSLAEVHETEVHCPGVFQGFWTWRNHSIRYQRCGSNGPAVIAIHGFGGNCDHWRKNIAELGTKHRVYSLDLLGYGYSSKPDPRDLEVNSLYNFDTWSDQILDFAKEVAGPDEKVFLTCNSVGGIAGLEAAIKAPERVASVQVMNISLRMLHEKKQSDIAKPFVSALQKTLRTTPLGSWFFSQIATEKGVRNVLQQCYCDKTTVTDELVDAILKPGLQDGAVDVFLDFISYSSGPLPEEQMARCPVPVSVVWGDADPWEKVEWGRAFQNFNCVEEFIELPGVGHCPQDEAPHLVNPIIERWIDRHV